MPPFAGCIFNYIILFTSSLARAMVAVDNEKEKRRNDERTVMVPGKLGKWNDLGFHSRTNLLAGEQLACTRCIIVSDTSSHDRFTMPSSLLFFFFRFSVLLYYLYPYHHHPVRGNRSLLLADCAHGDVQRRRTVMKQDRCHTGDRDILLVPCLYRTAVRRLTDREEIVIPRSGQIRTVV